MALLYGRGGRLTAQHGGFRLGQWAEPYMPREELAEDIEAAGTERCGPCRHSDRWPTASHRAGGILEPLPERGAPW